MLRTWNALWFSPFDPRPAAWFRITLGALIVADFLCVYPSWDRNYAATGMLSLYDPTVNSPVQGWWSVFWWTEGVLPARAYWFVGTAAAFAFTVGWHTRIATIALFLIVGSMVHRNPMVVNGEDLVFRMLLFYSCFAPLGATLSLDARRRRNAQPAAYAHGPNTIWPLRLMQINTLLIYAFSQPYKLAEDEVWIGGDAMYYAVVNGTWSRWPWPELFYSPWVSGLATYGSLAIELAFPVLVWVPRLRLPILVAMAGLHVIIAIALSNVTFFSLAMPCAFLVFLASKDVDKVAYLLRLPSLVSERGAAIGGRRVR